MLLYFARHGESIANLLHVFSNRELNHPLTEKGRAQSVELAQQLAKEGINLIYTSPVPRARETAANISEALGVPVVISPALREFDVGEFEGRTDEEAWSEFWQLFDHWMIPENWEAKLPGGESFNEIRARFMPFIQGLVREYRQTGTHILLISHGGIYRLMLPQVLANISQDYANNHMLKNTAYVKAAWTAQGLMGLEWAGESFSAE